MPSRRSGRKTTGRPAAKAKAPAERRPTKPARARVPPAPAAQRGSVLQYKVVELSTVDEHALEQTVNRWVRDGWNLDGVQFAMRESSKRPSMAFVFFTRDDLPPQQTAPAADDHDTTGAQARLRRLADDPGSLGEGEADVPAVLSQVGPQRPELTDERTWPEPPMRASDPWLRLQQLAGEDDDDTDGGDSTSGPRSNR